MSAAFASYPPQLAASLKRAGISGPAPGGEIVFFSGGSALNDVSVMLSALTSGAAHIISTFDSGGSSGALRRAFGVPAFGDLRRRISSLSGCAYFERRFGDGGPAELEAVRAALPPEHAGLLDDFLRLMPRDFPLAGAALGNLLMAAHYLQKGRDLYATVQRFASDLGARGLVLPVSEDAAHLAVRLESGAVLTGQHRFTGKETPEPSSPIREMFFCRGLDDPAPLEVRAGRGVLGQIAGASLICYPVGSFYSSLLANLQVSGVGRSILESPGRKLFVPNPGRDPESAKLTLEDELRAICRAVSGREEAAGALDCLLLDRENAVYRGGIPEEWCRRNGVKIIDYSCVDGGSGAPRLAPAKCALLLAALSGIDAAGAPL